MLPKFKKTLALAFTLSLCSHAYASDPYGGYKGFNAPLPQQTSMYYKIPVTDSDNIIVTKEQLDTYNKMTPAAQDLFKQAMSTQLRLENLNSAYPATSISAPTGFGASWGTIAYGADYDSSHWTTDVPDASANMDVGLGNSSTIAMDMVLAVTSIDASDDGFGDRGLLSSKIHHTFSSHSFAVAAGANNWGGWGVNQHTSFYFTATKVFILRPDSISHNLPLTINVGTGDSLYYDGAGNDVGDFSGKYNVFGSVALQVLPKISLIAEDVGKVVSAGFSVAPFKAIPMVATVAAYDIGEHLPDHDTSVYASVGFVHQFK